MIQIGVAYHVILSLLASEGVFGFHFSCSFFDLPDLLNLVGQVSLQLNCFLRKWQVLLIASHQDRDLL